MENFGERLRRLRGKRSQRRIASDLDMPVTTLSSLENQKTIPRGEVLEKLADYFKVPMSYFFRDLQSEPTGTDAAHAWLEQLREPAIGKHTIATQANMLLDDETKEKIAELLRLRNAKVSNHK
jgi:transcriptional regulator with XRE-family HTH domain